MNFLINRPKHKEGVLQCFGYEIANTRSEPDKNLALTKLSKYRNCQTFYTCIKERLDVWHKHHLLQALTLQQQSEFYLVTCQILVKITGFLFIEYYDTRREHKIMDLNSLLVKMIRLLVLLMQIGQVILIHALQQLDMCLLVGAVRSNLQLKTRYSGR